MTTDSASQEDVSFTGELTETGMKVAAKSRFVSALDRLGGNLVDLVGSPIDGWNERRKTKIAGEKQIIEAASRYGIDQLAKGDEFAARVFSNQFGKLAREQFNKDAVLEFALEDLRSSAKETRTASGKEKLDEVFLDRLDSYAAQATTEVLREKWGRVLAAEVRQPGTFSNKVLRVVDELDAETALLFEKLCQFRLGDTVPKCLSGALSFDDAAALSTSGLIIEPGLGQASHFSKGTTSDGTGLWIAAFGSRAVALPLNVSVPPAPEDTEAAVIKHSGTPMIPIYALTSVGMAISSILPDQQVWAFEAYTSKLAAFVRQGPVQIYEKHGGGFIKIREVPETAQ